MATIDFSNSAGTVDMTDPTLVDFVSVIDSSPGHVTWLTSAGLNITAYSIEDDLTYEETGAPSGGSIYAIDAYFPGDESNAHLYTASGLSVPVTALTQASGPEGYWRALLQGDTTIIGNANGQAAINGAGDFLNVAAESVVGGDDVYIEFVPGTYLYHTFAGDAKNVVSGTLTGGDDSLTIRSFGNFYGDANTNDGTLIGGDDTLLYDLADGNYSFLDGDSGTSTGKLTGGNDTITVRQSLGWVVQVSGDTNTIVNGTARGGNDTLTVETGARLLDAIAGDFSRLDAGIVYVGSDTIIGGNFLDRIYGDVRQLVGGTVLTDATHTGSDFLRGRGGHDQIFGQWGNDTLFGDEGNDTLSGGDGDDVIDGGADNDGIDGVTGSDTASYASATGAVNVSLLLMGAQQDTGAAGLDTLSNIDHLIGSNFGSTLAGDGFGNVLTGGNGIDTLRGGQGNDTLRGGLGNDVIFGGADADSLFGGANDDTLDGGLGTDTLDGVNGSDTASYLSATGAVTASLLLMGTQQNTGAGGFDTLFNIDHLTGSNFGSDLSGDNNANTLIGGNGVDTLRGGQGNDTLRGGLGSDTILGGANDDTIYGGGGADTLTGGLNNDTFWFIKGQANGDSLADFVGNGASLGDLLRFQGYGAGATFTQDTANTWHIQDGALSETITFSNSAAIHTSDYAFV